MDLFVNIAMKIQLVLVSIK